MRNGLAISILLHVAVLFWAVAVFPAAREIRSPQPLVVPVEIITASDLTKLKAGREEVRRKALALKKAKQERAAKARKPKAVRRKRVAVRKPPPAKKKAPVRKAKPVKPKKPTKPKKIARKKSSKPVAARKPTDSGKRIKPKKPGAVVGPKPRFSPDRIAALLNKVPDAGSRESVVARQDAERPEQAHGDRSGRDVTMTRSEIDALRQRISQCWNPPVGGLGADAIRVKLRMRLKENGSLARSPAILNSGGSPYFQVAADSAIRAVIQCQPYELPAGKFSVWRDLVLNFDPREMVGG